MCLLYSEFYNAIHTNANLSIFSKITEHKPSFEVLHRSYNSYDFLKRGTMDPYVLK